MNYRPALLPKVRSTAIMRAMKHYPCTLKIGGIIGVPCSDPETVVGCHLGTAGKGMSTKSSDLAVVAGCATCHALLDGRDHRWKVLMQDKYRAAVIDCCLRGLMETHAMLIRDGIIIVKGGTII